MTDPQNFRVVIIGGGLAGSCLANGLLRNGIDFSLYERLPENSKREGYQIRLGADALKGMRACLSPENLDLIVQNFGPASGNKSEAPVVRNEKFETMLDLTIFPTYNKSAPISRVILRDALAAPVAASGKLEYGKEFDRYEIVDFGTPKERVRVWFKDGSHDHCDILIGADGSHSKINKQIGLNNLVQLNDYTSMAAKSNLSAQRLQETNPKILEKPILTFADGKTLYYCAYLPKSSNSADSRNEDVSSSMFGFHVPSSTCPENLSSLSQKAKWDLVREILSEWSSEYHDIIELVQDSDIYVYRSMVSVNPGQGWRAKVRSRKEPEKGDSRIWLLGDAIHAMLPTRGMGGNTALRDTATALDLLRQLSSFSGPSRKVEKRAIDRACTEFEAEMIPRAFNWVRKSGGTTVVPVDASTIWGKVFFTLAAIGMRLSYYFQQMLGRSVNTSIVDDCPELK
ncbi:hypothetical protein COCVIDRAFT_43174 [Bipolaris victoriae FI3]|uniref:FAD-binding domain-containing protein n=1 Tax=Bipolaris victoriae (strain FI3) TaxID=930091 RepID=W7E9B0_BIPV3|nr:hypothetical protein COCVIDRAFT_43174 [Bipolaris victoriae FI3]